MKYNKSNKPLVCMQTQSTCYKGTSTMTVKGILWHSTGANNTSLKSYVQPSDNAVDKDEWLTRLGVNTYKNDWNHIVRQAGVNCWIGKLADGTITTVQTLPWNYRPWGCGSGPKGSCNNGWVQFEICEDNLTDKTYFEKTYKEACEITAYICDMYNIDPKGTVIVNGVKVPTILCHQDAYRLGLGSNHGDVLYWFAKFGKTMNDVREDVSKLLNKNTTPIINTNNADTEIYRVRKAWEDAKSQVGAYTILKNAKDACDKAGKDYEVYNSKGIAIYPEVKTENTLINQSNLEKGDRITLIPGTTYTSGKSIPAWVFKSKLYVKDILKNGDIIFSTQKNGVSIGIVKASNVLKYSPETTTNPLFTPYLVRVTTGLLNVRAGAGTNYKITAHIKRNEIYTIVAEKGNWGKLKSGAGWICLDYTKKV